MFNMKKLLISITVLAGLANIFVYCVKPPDYPIEPAITFGALSKKTMLQSRLGQDSIAVRFSFTDGDGDLGFQDTSASIFITDGRDSFNKPPYRIPFLGTQGVGNGISGEITIVVPTTCCIYPDKNGIKYPPCDTSVNAPQSRDTVFYWIQIKDRAGHLSNKIKTDPIELICRR
jgi:hypothetical protein